jgi:hypothetical protein
MAALVAKPAGPPLALLSLQACGQGVDLAQQANRIDDCCNIVSVDSARGIVEARETATGRTFSFSVTSQSLLGALRPGMAFDARSAPGATTFSLMNIANVRPDWFDDCCNLVGVATAAAETEEPDDTETSDDSGEGAVRPMSPFVRRRTS